MDKRSMRDTYIIFTVPEYWQECDECEIEDAYLHTFPTLEDATRYATRVSYETDDKWYIAKVVASVELDYKHERFDDHQT